MKLDLNARSSRLSRKLQDCFLDEQVFACLLEVDIDLPVPNDQFCAGTEATLLAEFECFKQCETFDCEADAELVVLTSFVSFQQEQRCGGVDALETCNTGTFTANDVESLIPQECLTDADIETCRVAANEFDEYADYEELTCDFAVDIPIAEFACLNECETFSCSALGDDFLTGFGELAAEEGCGDIDFKASCEAGKVVGVNAGEGLRAGAAIFLAVGAFALRMIR